MAAVTDFSRGVERADEIWAAFRLFDECSITAIRWSAVETTKVGWKAFD